MTASTRDERVLRVVSVLEAASAVLLVLVAVPLKHLAGAPDGVAVLGRVHGALFVLFVVALARVAGSGAWPPRRIALALALALVPGGALLVGRRRERSTSP